MAEAQLPPMESTGKQPTHVAYPNTYNVLEQTKSMYGTCDIVDEWDLNENWFIHEDRELLQAVQRVQEEMTLNSVVLCPAKTPDWNLVCEIVNITSHYYRTPEECKNRYESVILAQEEGQILQEQLLKKQKKKIYENHTQDQPLISRFNTALSISEERQLPCQTNNQSVPSQSTNTPFCPNAICYAMIKEMYGVDYYNPLCPLQVINNRKDRHKMIQKRQG